MILAASVAESVRQSPSASITVRSLQDLMILTCVPAGSGGKQGCVGAASTMPWLSVGIFSSVIANSDIVLMALYDAKTHTVHKSFFAGHTVSANFLLFLPKTS